MNSQILYPAQVTALRIGNEPKVTITASGYEDGFTNIRIEKSLATIYPPIYMVVGDPTPAIGLFPYQVSKTIDYSPDLDYINFTMANGTQRIPIFDVMKEHKSATPSAVLDSVKSTKATANRVVGYAYNSSNINIAISDAVGKLQAKFPGKVSAVMVESGFVAVGTPVGIAYYYVVMEQK